MFRVQGRVLEAGEVADAEFPHGEDVTDDHEARAGGRNGGLGLLLPAVALGTGSYRVKAVLECLVCFVMRACAGSFFPRVPLGRQ